MSAKLEEVLQNQVVSWATGIKIPSYLTSDGRPAPRPERVLGVAGEMKDGK